MIRTTLSLAAAVAFCSSPAVAQLTLHTSPSPVNKGYYGGAVAGVPDLDGDGVGDVVVGAPGEPVGALPGAGKVYILSGRTGKLLHVIVSPAPRAYGAFGEAVAGVPDVNGDKRGDIVIGAPLEGDNPVASGRAYIFSGATGKLHRVLWTPGARTGGNFGCSVSGLLDVDGDGRGDVIVGAESENPGFAPPSAGRAYVYSGKTGKMIRKVLPPHPQPFGAFGCAVAGLGDINGDGRGDYIVGAFRTAPGGAPVDVGRAYVYSGATGVRLFTLAPPAPKAAAHFGLSVSGVPDVDGDGRPDIVVGAPGHNPVTAPFNCGRVYVFSGKTGKMIRKLLPPKSQEDGQFGVSVAGFPDYTGDGRGDIVVGAWNETPATGPWRAGRVHIYSGATGKIHKVIVSPWKQESGRLGVSVGGIDNAKGTGKGGIVVGGAAENNAGTPEFSGRIYIFRW